MVDFVWIIVEYSAVGANYPLFGATFRHAYINRLVVASNSDDGYPID